MIRVAIIIGSTRPGRKGEAVAQWGLRYREQAKGRRVRGCSTSVASRRTDSSRAAVLKPRTKRWAAKIDSFDALA